MENQNGSLTHCLHRWLRASDIRPPMLRHRNALGEMSYLPPHCPDCGGNERFPLPRERVRYSRPHATRRKRAVLRLPVDGEAVGGLGTCPIGPDLT